VRAVPPVGVWGRGGCLVWASSGVVSGSRADTATADPLFNWGQGVPRVPSTADSHGRAGCTQVKRACLAHCALVAGADNRVHFAAVALDERPFHLSGCQRSDRWLACGARALVMSRLRASVAALRFLRGYGRRCIRVQLRSRTTLCTGPFGSLCAPDSTRDAGFGARFACSRGVGVGAPPPTHEPGVAGLPYA
jgi:hypothetical protein